MEDIQYHEMRRKNSVKDFLKKYPCCTDYFRSCQIWLLDPVYTAYEVEDAKIKGFGLGRKAPREAPVDFLPTGEKSARVFLLHREGLMSVWSAEAALIKQKVSTVPPEAAPERDMLQWKLDFSAKPVEFLHTGLDDTFLVLPETTDLFFLTDSGKLFRVVEESKDGKKRKVLAAVWSDPKKPIHAVITDADADKHYLFGKESKEKGFFFELEARPRPRPFAFADLPDNRAEEHLRTILRYATLLRPQKKK